MNDAKNLNRKAKLEYAATWQADCKHGRKVGSPPTCLQTARLFSKNTITETIRSIWFAKPQETERDSPGSPAPLVPPIRILGAGDQDPFPLTTQWKLTSTQPNSPLSLYKKFWQCGILT